MRLKLNTMLIEFQKIAPTAEQTQALYELLNERVHKISHGDNVSFNEHNFFVENHPYRAWYLVFLKGDLIGSFYINNDNTIGINLDFDDSSVISKIITYVKSNFEPLDAIPSVRADRFSINVPPSNKSLSGTLASLGAELAQLTYYFP